MATEYKGVYYPEYLHLEKLLESQTPLSKAHDEMLFIIVHQAYEVWFKQILHELDSILQLFEKEKLSETALGICVHRMQRILKIVHLIPGHFDILETMTPMDFLEFRNLLVPASGFQSLQFRSIEIKLGLLTAQRVPFDQQSFHQRLKEHDKEYLYKLEKQQSLFELVEHWLERMPFIQHEDFHFWKEYEKKVYEMLEKEEHIIRTTKTLSEIEQKKSLEQITITRTMFHILFEEEAYKQKANRRLSRKATLAALFIFIYRDEPILQMPFQFLQSIIELDELISSWRYRHALMVQRMLGTKIGTGGSSGYDYLKATTTTNRIFKEFMDLSTYLIPRSEIPILPKSLSEKMNFNYV